MAPAYTTPQGKTVGLPGCWISSPVHCGQNVVHAEADWTLRLGKETKSQRRLDSRESTEYTFPQFHDDSPVKDPFAWGSGAVREGLIANPMHSNRRTTMCGLPPKANHWKTKALNGFASKGLSEQDRPSSASSVWVAPPGLMARTWDTGHGQSWDNGMAAMAMLQMEDLPSKRKQRERQSKRGPRAARPKSAADVSTTGAGSGEVEELRHMLRTMQAKTSQLEARVHRAEEESGAADAAAASGRQYDRPQSSSALGPKETLRTLIREELRNHMGQGTTQFNARPDSAMSVSSTTSSVRKMRSSASLDSNWTAPSQRAPADQHDYEQYIQQQVQRQVELHHIKQREKHAKAANNPQPRKEPQQRGASGYRGLAARVARERKKQKAIEMTHKHLYEQDLRRKSARVLQLQDKYSQSRKVGGKQWQTTNPMAASTYNPARFPQQNKIPTVVCGGNASRYIRPEGASDSELSAKPSAVAVAAGMAYSSSIQPTSTVCVTHAVCSGPSTRVSWVSCGAISKRTNFSKRWMPSCRSRTGS